MPDVTGRPSGNIYDLGYQPYTGTRMGRRHAITSLSIYSLRAIFGLGRSTMSKVFPIGLCVLALIPALVQLAIAAVAPREVTLVRPENHLAYVEVVIVLFCAVVTPEIIGRDQRYRILPLYFSRALERTDYVAAKLLGLFVALLAVLLIPQVLLLTGSAVATQDITAYLQDNASDLAPIVASSIAVAVFFTTISLAIASTTSNRAFASGMILGYFIIFASLGSILIETATGDIRKYSALLSPFDVMQGTVHWFFNAPAPGDSDLTKAGLEGSLYFLGLLVYVAASLGVLYRRFQRMTV
jgi:ABC-2 type transport system permease protein